MHFSGPQAQDFDDVYALNRAFLESVRRDPWLERCIDGLSAELAARLRSASRTQLERLAGTPFLLFSFRERDTRFWDNLHAGGPPRYDLFAAGHAPSPAGARLVAAGLGFVWQLARQNPYALRLICGASLYWCERLSELPLVYLLDRAMRDDLLVLRSADDVNLWRKLLWGGVSRQKEVRVAAQLGALHMMLTRPDARRETEWSSAACRTRVPAVRIADERKR